MKELIEKLKNYILKHKQGYVITINIDEAEILLQALTSVKSESAEVIENNSFVKEIEYVQIGTSFNADFEEKLWAFQFDNDFEVKAGRYAIVPIEIFDKLSFGLNNSISEDARNTCKTLC